MHKLTNWILIGLLILATGLLPSTTVWSASRLALVVGSNTYDSLPILQKAVNDARAITTALKKLDFTVLHGENLSRREMNRKMLELESRITPGDQVLFFFAGHGVALGGENYLLPRDMPLPKSGEESLVRDDAHAVSRLVERIQNRGAAATLLVLDACRDNPFAIQGTRSIGISRGLTRTEAPSGVFILFSAGIGQAALDRLHHNDPHPNSVFTRKLLPLLDTPGLTHIELAKQVQSDVAALAKSVNHQQQPAYYDQILGNLILTPPSIVAQPEPTPTLVPISKTTPSTPELEAFKIAKSANTIAAWDIFLAHYQNGFYAELATVMRSKLLTTNTISSPTPSKTLDNSGFIFPGSHQRRLSISELEQLSTANLRIARNEIFARLGRYFKSADLQHHFNRFPWYQPHTWKPSLNKIEQDNVKLIKSVEQYR